MKKDAPRLRTTRTPLRLQANPERVIARLFAPGDGRRIQATVGRILSMDRAAKSAELARVMASFSTRHKDLQAVFLAHANNVLSHLDNGRNLSDEQRILLGAYYTMEYSIESVALFNPSIVSHFDQSGLAGGEARFILSLRACGEGHISSIEFRSGVIHADNRITVDPPTDYAVTEQPVEDKLYEKHPFFLKLIEMGVYDYNTQAILDRLTDTFTLGTLENVVAALRTERRNDPHFIEEAEKVLWLARSNYALDFPSDVELSERVIFPVTENESRGIEDARFVKFTKDDGATIYYATYTAYNGLTILPQFIETEDFRHFKIITLNGKTVQNKGMALFPRTINGEYHMLSRLDGEHLYLMNSDNLHFWNRADRLDWKRQPWEFMQVGNCGSPIETDDGWLVLTHGVGAVRRYCIGAALLDLENPTRVIGTASQPLIVPGDEERDGYVPNVVYSCGAIIHNDHLIIPYAMSDTWTGMATVSVEELLDHLRN